MKIFRVCAASLMAAGLVGAPACTDRKAGAEALAPGEGPTPPHTQGAPAGAASAGIAPIPGVDLSGFTESEKASFGRLIQKYPSACGKAHSLEVSVRTDPGCRRSMFAVRYIVRLIRAHLLESEVEENFEKRFSATKSQVDIAGAPLRGEPHAPVTLIEFSDFQCPHCKDLQPILERLLDEYRGQVRLYFKNYPIPRAHPDAEGAAAAAMAAGKQGKFWQFHDRLFAGDQNHEAMNDLEKIAKDLKLDQKKWKGDIAAAKDVVAKDRSEGEKLEVAATPTLYINGRKYSGPHQYDDIKDWVEEELNK
jgi:protein-disulfide isomerase